MSEETPASVLSKQGQWTRVVVLMPPQNEAPRPPQPGPVHEAPPLNDTSLAEPLRAAFAARDWFPILQHDPYLAFAELSLREQAQSSRAAWGLQRMEEIALVIVSTTVWPAEIVHDLASAVRSHL